MKIFFLLFFLVLNQATASDVICKLSTIKAVRTEVQARKITDKNMHCSASCLLTLVCSPADVLAIGIAKELLDVVTPGDSDIEDLKADIKGIRLVTSGTARDKNDCYARCLSYFPNP